MRETRPPLLTSLLLFCLLAAGGARDANAAWTHPAGHGYAKLGSSTFGSFVGYDEEGRLLEPDGFVLVAQTFNGYLELGLADRLTVVGSLPLVLSTNRHDSGIAFHTVGAGDAQLGLRASLWQPQVPVVGVLQVSAQLDVKMPLYEGAPALRGRSTVIVPGYPKTSRFFPALGDGQVDISGRAMLGGSLPVVDGFFSADAGWRMRAGPVTDAALANANVGVWLFSRALLVQGHLQSVLSLPNAMGEREMRGKGFVTVGASLVVPVWGGFNFECGADVLPYGVNTAAGGQLHLGVSYAG